MAKKKKQEENKFKVLLEKYLDIKGLDIVILMIDGEEIELSKNRIIEDDSIITYETNSARKKIPLSKIKSVELYAA